eukprot:5584454-Amphidinium_carterae.4
MMFWLRGECEKDIVVEHLRRLEAGEGFTSSTAAQPAIYFDDMPEEPDDEYYHDEPHDDHEYCYDGADDIGEELVDSYAEARTEEERTAISEEVVQAMYALLGPSGGKPAAMPGHQYGAVRQTIRRNTAAQGSRDRPTPSDMRTRPKGKGSGKDIGGKGFFISAPPVQENSTADYGVFAGLGTIATCGLLDTAGQAPDNMLYLGVRAINRSLQVQGLKPIHSELAPWGSETKGVGGAARVVKRAAVPIAFGGVCGNLDLLLLEVDNSIVVAWTVDSIYTEPTGHMTRDILTCAKGGWKSLDSRTHVLQVIGGRPQVRRCTATFGPRCKAQSRNIFHLQTAHESKCSENHQARRNTQVDNIANSNRVAMDASSMALPGRQAYACDGVACPNAADAMSSYKCGEEARGENRGTISSDLWRSSHGGAGAEPRQDGWSRPIDIMTTTCTHSSEQQDVLGHMHEAWCTLATSSLAGTCRHK